MWSLIINYGQQSRYTFSDDCGMQYIFYFENLLRSLSQASTNAQLLPKLPTLQGTWVQSFKVLVYFSIISTIYA